MFERATREWRMSPTMVTVRPSIRPFSSRTVSRSSRAWVGCSCQPSPALITGASRASAIWRGTPATAWRTTTASGSMASRVLAVSRMLSAFLRLELDGEKLITSAESRLPAISKLVRVRVDGSKKRFTMVRPRRVGTFFTSRVPTSCMRSAVSRMRSRSERSRSSMPSRSRPITSRPPRYRPRRPRGGRRGCRRSHPGAARGPRCAWGCSCPRSRG